MERTFEQSLTELMCKRQAEKENVKLTDRFWQTSEKWKAVYKRNIIQINKITKLYDKSVIMKVVRELSWCFSVNNKTFKEKLSEEQHSFDIRSEIENKKEVVKENNEVQKIRVKKSSGSGLRGKI